MKNKKQLIIAVIILFIAALLSVASVYYKINYAEQTFDTILYHLTRGAEKANYEVIGKAIKVCILPLIGIVLILLFPFSSFGQRIYSLETRYKSKKMIWQIYPNRKIIKHKILYSVIIFVLGVIFALGQIGLYEYIKIQSRKSTIYEDEYVASENVKITFPEEKRNLIYIFLEATETTVASKESGGSWNYSIIPGLEELALENINFSHTEQLGGAVPVAGTGWTIAGMLAQTSGVPLKVSIDINSYSGYSSFLPGVYSLGDILKQEGYNLKLMVGSDATFGGRRDYFTSHGNYEIFDLYTAIDEGKMKAEDEVWWGYEDTDLFQWAKDEILEMAKEDEPFNFIMLTADTHFYDGYLSEYAELEYPTRYENVFAYTSKLVSEFVEWIQEQDFYENTTIVIVGDHMGMQTDFYGPNVEDGYTRTVFNTFINSAIPETNSKNRQFCTLDIFPTVLASMGVKIEGERLGLGTNLFSGEKTLIEKYGYDYVNTELSKNSDYYNKNLLKDDYYKMLTGDMPSTITE